MSPHNRSRGPPMFPAKINILLKTITHMIQNIFEFNFFISKSSYNIITITSKLFKELKKY